MPTLISLIFAGRNRMLKIRRELPLTSSAGSGLWCAKRHRDDRGSNPAGPSAPGGRDQKQVLAAHRAGLTRVILPKKNERDIDDVPKDVLDQLEVIFAKDMSEVLEAALEKTPTPFVGRPSGTYDTLL